MVSNRTLALFIIGTVIISLGGTLLSLNKLQELEELQKRWIPPRQLTGLATGKVELNITTNMSCRIDTNVSFGNGGQPTSTNTLSSDKANTGNFNDCTSGTDCVGLQINNTGNVDINVTLVSDKNGSTLLAGQTGADNTDFQYNIRNGTATSSGDGTQQGCKNIQNAGWASVPTTTTTICTNLTFTDSNDMMTTEFNVTIEPDLPTGLKTAQITIGCAQN